MRHGLIRIDYLKYKDLLTLGSISMDTNRGTEDLQLAVGS